MFVNYKGSCFRKRESVIIWFRLLEVTFSTRGSPIAATASYPNIGDALYAVSAGEMVVDASQVRAITGRTGWFIGARGQITTTRRDAGHYDHKIELIG